jgi:hypothetical protein
MLINRFCDNNGTELLQPCFREINRKEYRNKILFDRSEFNKFVNYFHFKTPFFIPADKENESHLTELVLQKIRLLFEKEGGIEISKDDSIFICAEPIKV